MSAEERTLARVSFPHRKLISVLRDQELLNDCIQYPDYLEWRKSVRSGESVAQPVSSRFSVQ